MGNQPTFAVSQEFQKPRGTSIWIKLLVIFIAVAGLLMTLVCGGLMYIGAITPDTKAVPGAQMRNRDLRIIETLKLLEPGEQVRYFYSDGLFSADEGMYFYTDRRVVMYMKDAAEPLISVPFEQIIAIDAEYSDNWMNDSIIWVDLEDGSGLAIPVSIEAGGDKQFHDGLVMVWQQHKDGAERATPSQSAGPDDSG